MICGRIFLKPTQSFSQLFSDFNKSNLKSQKDSSIIKTETLKLTAV